MDKDEFIKEKIVWGEPLGKGTFGTVFEIEYKGKKFAGKKIKKYLEEEIKLNEDYIKLLYNREVDTLKKMSKCENSVKYYNSYEEKDNYIIILELCDTDLNEIIEEKEDGLNSSEILYIMNDLNKAFKYMNEQSIIHRDIKPDNIMIKYIDSSKQKFIPKIGDYGISRTIDEEGASTVCGSPIFRAPEIIEQKYNDKVDLYSIGVLIYYMYFKEYPKKKCDKVDLKSNININSKDALLQDLLNKLLVDSKKRLSWPEYFNHPFFSQDKIIINIYDSTLENIAIQSCIIKKDNEIDQKSKENFISIDECLNYKNKDKKDDNLFILGILSKYFTKIGIKTILIEKEDLPRNEIIRNYHKVLFQFICNGYILKSKYILNFGLNNDRRMELVKDPNERSKFNEKIKNIMLIKYNLKDEEIIITNYRLFNDQFTAIIIFKSNFNENITKNELIEIFKNDEDLKYLTNIEKELIIPSIRLNASMLDCQEHNKDNKWRENEKRGGEPYFPPIGWTKYGIRVRHCFDNKNNDWIYLHNKKEWCTAYCPITNKITQKYENENDIKHPGKKVGIGVYCYTKSDEMGENTEEINIKGYKYKIGFIIKVKPDKIRCPENNKNIWVVNGNHDEFRPYGILIK